MVPGPLSLQYQDSVTTQMQTWIEEAIRRCRFPKDRAGINLIFTVAAEPPAAGHNDFMSTTSDGSPTGLVTIREGADQLDADFNQSFETPSQLQLFFQEAVIHEFAHAFTNTYMATSDERKALIASWMRRDVLGDRRLGTLADWDADPEVVAWVDRVKEGFAEFFKDTFLPEQYRYFEQRTNWTFIEGRFGDFYDMLDSIICPGA